MKRILAILVTLILVFNMTFVTAFAENGITLDIKYDSSTKAYIVSGYIDAVLDRIPVSLFMKHENGSVVGLGETVAIETTEGIKFTFPPVPLKASTLSGNIEVKVTAAHLNYNLTVTEYYYGADKHLEALTTLKNAIQSGDEDTLKAAVSSTKDILMVDDSLLLNLTNETNSTKDALSIALSNLFLLELDLPEDYSTKEKCNQISNQISVYQESFKEAVTLGRFFELTSKEEIKNWYDTNKEVYGLSVDDTNTPFDETKLLSYFNEALSSDEYVSRMDKIRFVNTISELNIEMKKQAVLQRVKDSSQNVISRVLTELSGILSNVNDANGQNPVSFNFSLWNLLTDDQKSAVCLNVAGRNYDDIYSFINKVNSEINNIFAGSTPVYSGSPSSDRGGKGNNKPIALPPETKEDVPVMNFTDIENMDWAKEAISYLYRNNIITGRNTYTFAPDDKVTRAELAKMLVLAFKLSGTKDSSFSDVSKNAWYADYVNIAAANGIILGDDSGKFNPDNPVSRQDAAVMMYRAVNSKVKAKKADFEDYSQISVYAHDAIDYMYENAIINGVGDGNFAPLSSITRAQSAKMMYMLLVK